MKAESTEFSNGLGTGGELGGAAVNGETDHHAEYQVYEENFGSGMAENGHRHAAGVIYVGEFKIELKAENKKLFSNKLSKETSNGHCVSEVPQGEKLRSNGYSCEVKRVEENGVGYQVEENQALNPVAKEGQDSEVELVSCVNVEEDGQARSLSDVVESDLPGVTISKVDMELELESELEPEVEVDEESESDFDPIDAEDYQNVEVESANKVVQDPEDSIAEANHQAKLDSDLKVEEEEYEISNTEIGPQSDLEVVEEHESELVQIVVKAHQDVKVESAKKVVQNLQDQMADRQAKLDVELDSDLKVEQEEYEISNTEINPQSDLEVVEEHESELVHIVVKAHQDVKVESAKKAVQDLQDQMADRQAKLDVVLDSDLKVEQEEYEISNTEIDSQSDLEVVEEHKSEIVHIVAEDRQDVKVESATKVVQDLQDQVADHQAKLDVELDSDLKVHEEGYGIRDTEIDPQSYLEVVEEHESELVDIVAKAPRDVKVQSANKVVQDLEDQVAEANHGAELNSDPKVEEEKYETTDTHLDPKNEPELSAKIEEHQPQGEIAGIDVHGSTETIKVGDTALETNLQSEPELSAPASFIGMDIEHESIKVGKIGPHHESKTVNADSWKKENESEPSEKIEPEKVKDREANHCMSVNRAKTKQIPTPQLEHADLPLDAEGEELEPDCVKEQYFMIIVPRFFDDELRTKLQQTRSQLDEKTQIRDSIRVEIQKQKSEYREKFEVTKAEDQVARAALSAKRQEKDSTESKIIQMKNASAVKDINDKIHKREQTLKTIPLPQNNKHILELRQWRQLRDKLSAKMSPEAEINELFNNKDQIEADFKTLQNEFDTLTSVVLRAECNVKAALNKFSGQFRLRDLQEKLRIADDNRQEAFSHMQSLRNQLTEKNKYFNMYNMDRMTASNLVMVRDKESLRTHCSKQVENVMHLWNKNDEFRKQYIKSKVNFRRSGSSNGRSFDSEEKPPLLPSSYKRSSSSIPVPILGSEMKMNNSNATTVERLGLTTQTTKTKTSSISEGAVCEIEEVEAVRNLIKETKKEAPVNKANQLRKEEELAREASELEKKKDEDIEFEREKKIEEFEKNNGTLRKEKATLELKEQCRLEQKAKAEEAKERKKRQAEKARAKAESRAKKEAELKEKKRAKKEKKPDSKESTDEIAEGDDILLVDAAQLEPSKEPETTNITTRQRSSRTQAYAKQYKMEPLPLPLRNRRRRTMTTWIWFLLSILLVAVVFLVGNYIPIRI